MPKKSKKAKILADSHRKTIQSQQFSHAQNPQISHHESLSYSITPHLQKNTVINPRVSSPEIQAVKKDMVVTVILAIIAISSEIVLSVVIH
jgi:hypothetical protein